MSQATLLLSVLLCVGGDQAPAPPSQIHRLADSTLVEGRLRRQGEDYLLETAFGQRRLGKQSYGGVAGPLAPVAEEYGGLVKHLNARSLQEQLAVARWCVKVGYLSGLRERLNAILRLDVDQPYAVETLEKMAPLYGISRLDGSAKNRDQRRFIEELIRLHARKDNVGAVVAANKLRRLPAKLRYRQVLKALRDSSARVRWVGARVLREHQGEGTRISPLLKRSISDASAAVRRASAQALAATNDEALVRILAKHLGSPKAMIRIRAARALGEFKSTSAARAVVGALADSWRPNRNFVASTKQIAYVKDYDVEVAQTAFIADPVVDVVQEGAVLEVAVVSVAAERRAYRSVLTGLAGKDLGERAGPWSKWLESR